ESRLPGPARTAQRHEPVRVDQCQHLSKLALAADQGRRLDRQVGLVERLERRELAVAELEDPFGRCQVLEPMLAEIIKPVCARELTRPLRDQNLATMARGGDPRRPVNVEADITLLGEKRLAGMEAHPDLDRTAVQGRLTLRRRGERIMRSREDDEEGVSFSAELDPVVACERVSQKATVLCQRFGI